MPVLSAQTWCVAPARGTWRTFPGARRGGREPGLTSTQPHLYLETGKSPDVQQVPAVSATGSMPGPVHVPVLRDRVLALFAPAVADPARPNVVVDATVGLGGHAEALLSAYLAGQEEQFASLSEEVLPGIV